MTAYTLSQLNRSTHASCCVYAAAALLLVGCQTFSGLSDLEADGKNVRDAGGPSVADDREGTGGTAGHAISVGGVARMTDAGPYAGDAAAGGSSGGHAAGSGGNSASDAGGAEAGAAGSGGKAPSAGSAGASQPPHSACVPPAAGGASCDNTAQCGCEDTENCVFYSDSNDSLKLTCRAAGTKQLYKACDWQAQDCQRGYQCLDGLCQAPCEDDTSQCPNAGSQCIQGNAPSGLAVMGLHICTQPCNPVAPAQDDDTFHGCGAGHTCYVNLQEGTEYYTNCRSGNRDVNSRGGYPCKHDDECAEGHFCATDARCYPFCRIGGGDCLAGQICSPWDKKVSVKDTEFGVCLCPGLEPNRGPCDLTQRCGCALGDKCDVAADGKSACFPAGSSDYAAPCQGVEDCQAGFNCFDGTCHRLCEPAMAASICDAATCQRVSSSKDASATEFYVCRGGFRGTCMDIHNTETLLVGDCTKLDRSVQRMSTLDLNARVTYNDKVGQLEFQPAGGFAADCKDMVVTNTAHLTATCHKDGQAEVAVDLDLNNRIANVDGALVFN
jgi:hypothetical protein